MQILGPYPRHSGVRPRNLCFRASSRRRWCMWEPESHQLRAGSQKSGGLPRRSSILVKTSSAPLFPFDLVGRPTCSALENPPALMQVAYSKFKMPQVISRPPDIRSQVQPGWVGALETESQQPQEKCLSPWEQAFSDISWWRSSSSAPSRERQMCTSKKLENLSSAILSEFRNWFCCSLPMAFPVCPSGYLGPEIWANLLWVSTYKMLFR